ncbi:hypothetical protein [Shimazuella soli]|nr:hypothetical protein [Shimazuella soli]
MISSLVGKGKTNATISALSSELVVQEGRCDLRIYHSTSDRDLL